MKDLKNKQVVFGGTGAIGRELLDILTNNGEEVIAIVRKEGNLPEAVEQVIVEDQTQGHLFQSMLKDADVYVCIGTTQAKTPNRDQYYRIDHGIPAAIADAAQESRSVHVVSALGANADSKMFYNRTKGEMERDVLESYPEAFIYQPSLLLGDREEKRTAEKIAKSFFSIFSFLIPKKYRGIHHATVAMNMYENKKALPEKRLWVSSEMLDR